MINHCHCASHMTNHWSPCSSYNWSLITILILWLITDNHAPPITNHWSPWSSKNYSLITMLISWLITDHHASPTTNNWSPCSSPQWITDHHAPPMTNHWSPCSSPNKSLITMLLAQPITDHHCWPHPFTSLFLILNSLFRDITFYKY